MANRKSQDAAPQRPSAELFRFGYIVHDVSRIRRTVMDKAMRPLGVTRSQWSLLSALSRGGNDGMMQADIARLMEVGKVTVGGLVDRLEATGHVVRKPDANDRRAKRVFITEEGYNVIEKMITVANEINDRILMDIPEGNRLVTEDTLFHIKANLKKILEEGDQGTGGK